LYLIFLPVPHPWPLGGIGMGILLVFKPRLLNEFISGVSYMKSRLLDEARVR
jgi:hypothetical protein